MKITGVFSVLILSAALIFVIIGCATDKVAYDLVDYVNQGLLRIEELEKRSLEEYAGVTGNNYKNDREVYETLKTKVIPTYQRFVEGLREINPNEDEVRRVHGVYVRAAEKELEGFKNKMRGIKRNDIRTINAGNEMIENGSREIEGWREELLALCAEHGVAPGKKPKK